LKRHKYPNLTALEGDLKRMVTNAKVYNEKSSLIYADAERIRKILSSNMPKINPAYKNPKYVALPTPLPDEGPNDAGNVVPNKQKREPTSSTSTRGTSRSGDSQVARLTPPMEDHQSEGSFEGNTLREAQDRIMSELFHLKDSE
jgi:chromatin structure-remodeling complex subunit RSC4